MEDLWTKISISAAILLGLLTAGLLTVAQPTMAERPPLNTPYASPLRQSIHHSSVLTDEIEIVLETEPSVANALTRLEAGELDIYAAPTSSSDVLQQIEASPNLEGYRTYGDYSELTLNTFGPEFNDGRLNPFSVPRIREAMNYLIDRTHIAEEILEGLARPRYVPINFASKDTAVLADVIAAIELEYAYDKEKAEEIVTEEMEKLGAEMVDGTWTYNGEPVEIIELIRWGSRRETGDYFGDQLEDVGFSVTRHYGDNAELGPIWAGSHPAEGLFHIYTGGWSSSSISRDSGANFLFFYTPDGYPGVPLWDNYTPSEAFYQLARDLANNNFSTMQERRDMMAQALKLAMEDSARVWLVDYAAITPRRADISYASDLCGGITGSQLWAQTLRRDGSLTTSVNIALPNMFINPWNPIAGSNWAYDLMPIRATQHGAVVSDPFTGVMGPMRLESAEVFIKEGLPVEANLDWVTLEFVDEITVPDDAWSDWDAEKQVFITAAEKYTETQAVKSKVVMHYEDDFFDKVTWHDGSPCTIGDFVMFMIMQFDRAKEASPVYDQTYVRGFEAFMDAFKGWRIASQDPLVIEYYTNAYALDAENNVTNFTAANPVGYSQGEGAWHTIALGWHAEANGEAAFSSSKATELGGEWMDFVSGPTLDILASTLDEASVESFVPYSPTLGQYITATQVTERLANLVQWHSEHGHFWVGTGPLYLDDVSVDTGELILKPNGAYPDPPDRWEDSATEALIVDVSVEGPASVERGEEAVFTVQVTLDGEPYPDRDIDAVRYLVLNSQGQVQFTGEATPVVAMSDSLSANGRLATTEGMWSVILDADMIRRLPPGATRLEIVVTTKPIVVPRLASLLFTAPNVEVYLPLVVRSLEAESSALKLGVLGPFTGPNSRTGDEFKGAVNMAFEAIDWRIGSYSVEPIWIDSESNPTAAAENYEEAILQDGLEAGLLNWHSSVAVACMDVVGEHRVPHFAGFGATEVVNEIFNSDRETYGYWTTKWWPTPTNFPASYVHMLEHAIDSGDWNPAAKTVVISGENTTWGHTFGNAIKGYFQDAGWTVLGESYFNPGQTDFSSALAVLTGLDPAVVAGSSYSAESVHALINQADAAGLESVIIADGLGYTPDWYGQTGDSSNYILDQTPPAWITPEAQAFADAFEAEYGISPIPAIAGLAYDAANFFIHAAKATYQESGELTSRALYEFAQQQIWTGQWSYTDGIIMQEYKYTEETIPDPIFGDAYYIFPVVQYFDGEPKTVFPTDWADQSFTPPGS